MGEVWRGRDLSTRQPVAVKLVQLANIDDQTQLGDTITRFRREADTLTRLKHPNIIAALEAGRVGSELFMVMELADGISMQEMLRQRQANGLGLFPVESVLRIAKQACAGLAAATSPGTGATPTVGAPATSPAAKTSPTASPSGSPTGSPTATPSPTAPKTKPPTKPPATKPPTAPPTAPPTTPPPPVVITAAAANPAEVTGTCPAALPTISVPGTISSSQATTVTYFWSRSDGTTSAAANVAIAAGGSVSVPDSVTAASNQWQLTDTLEVTSPSAHSASATASVACTYPTLTLPNPGTQFPELDEPFSLALAPSGGNGSYTWSATGLPPGLSITSGGVITGTPTEEARFQVTVTVTDTEATPQSTSVRFIIDPEVRVT